MTTKATWDQIVRATEAQPSARGLYHFTMGAEENASTTIYEEKAAPAEDFYRLALGSLEGLLCDTDDRDAQAFFTALGVRF